MRTLAATLAPLSLLVGPAAWAHQRDGETIASWHWEPWIVVPLLLTALLFARGYRTLRKRSGRGDYRLRGGYFLGGWLTLTIALVSPLHEAGERSFSAHMLEHELIMLAAAPALVLARPAVILLWGFPGGARQAVGGLAGSRVVRLAWDRLTAPVTATVVQAAVLWGWHSPALFDLALESETWHAVQHASFLVSALLFWSAMLTHRRGQALAGPTVAAFCLFATSLVSGALGALMAFSESPWYAPYAALGMSPYGLTPAEDQQVAGLIMWVPGGLVHAIAALAMVGMVIRRPARGEASDAL